MAPTEKSSTSIEGLEKIHPGPVFPPELLRPVRSAQTYPPRMATTKATMQCFPADEGHGERLMFLSADLHVLH